MKEKVEKVEKVDTMIMVAMKIRQGRE